VCFGYKGGTLSTCVWQHLEVISKGDLHSNFSVGFFFDFHIAKQHRTILNWECRDSSYFPRKIFENLGTSVIAIKSQHGFAAPVGWSGLRVCVTPTASSLLLYDLEPRSM